MHSLISSIFCHDWKRNKRWKEQVENRKSAFKDPVMTHQLEQMDVLALDKSTNIIPFLEKLLFFWQKGERICTNFFPPNLAQPFVPGAKNCVIGNAISKDVHDGHHLCVETLLRFICLRRATAFSFHFGIFNKRGRNGPYPLQPPSLDGG